MGKKVKAEKNSSSKSGTTSKEKNDKKLRKISAEIAELRKKYIKVSAKQAKLDVADYVLKDTGGNDVKLSEMFGDKENLILIHNMGKACSYCTLWADGFSGEAYYIEKKAAFVLVSPDAPEVQKEFAASRGWKFRTYSAAGTTFIADMGYYTEAEGYWPGVSVFHKDAEGKINRVSKDYFGPGDFYSAPWHFFDLLPETKEDKEK
ncbi:MAG TPA: DUF899 family protein [Ignavibacteria bacterium]|nr:DUF899 family protein [Ignavibacteria bacterium]HMQ99340.1 DUF899 family protein [Ignavibacteria bacterium]